MTLRHPQQNPGTSIAHFKGRLLVAVQLRSQRWEIDQLQKMQPQTRMMDGVPITASSFTAESGGDGYQLRATIPRAWTNRAFVEEVMASMRSKLRVVDGAGRALPLRDVSEHGLGDQISIEAEFARDPQGDGTSPTAPTKLLWDIPSETRSISIPVELSDLPISDYFR